jgi:hypothetical protein
MITENVFEIPDLYLSSAIAMILKVEPSYSVRNNRTFFCFSVSDELYKTMGAYNAGFLLPAIEYAETIKRLRAEMLMRRKPGASNGR